jgi:hypothetical protein
VTRCRRTATARDRSETGPARPEAPGSRQSFLSVSRPGSLAIALSIPLTSRPHAHRTSSGTSPPAAYSTRADWKPGGNRAEAVEVGRSLISPDRLTTYSLPAIS